VVNVTIMQIGAAPAELEANVTQYIENAVASIANVRNIQSTIKDQISETAIEFQLGTDIEQATNDVRSAINQIRSILPNEIEEPIIQRVGVIGGPMVHYTVKSPKLSSLALSWFIDDTIIHHLLAVPGVEKAVRFGGSEREIRIEVDPQ